MSDEAHMRAALQVAARGLGNTWPNPSVGCVLVKNGVVIARGWTQPGGRPHAEVEALTRAGEAARGATAYVTLEPCSHHGRTPPCCDALIRAGVSRVVVALRDPDGRVDGRGLARLRAAGIAVEEGLMGAEAAALNAGFIRRVTQGLPIVTLKLASTLDGRIATASGESRWITGEGARRAVHALRARHDAVMVGSGTAIADDPELDCRIPGLDPVPMLRVVADARLRLPLGSKLVAGARSQPTWVLTGAGHRPASLTPFIAAGVEVVTIRRTAGGGLQPRAMLQALGARGVTRVMVEGGANLAASLLKAGLVDRLVWFHAPAALGAEGLASLGSLGVGPLAAMPRFRLLDSRRLGADIMSDYVKE
ncbi:bifunctional diaminohydroxyphosphoribosylaminopyrimidine deaminase/5-amino-6-(5-phosphoribosylamino)uracil reductase RibD [Roseococcus sp. SYP-B2431]|uniref:bifunctional diaminohydroxyphosphoribosylaminopyrimidine deaminase/5-amino-6-(5-phosphoribosylamino)uracil reductase RibD n=1 Tax=Roseococcus sp. SYP-B2431 TaxID=2496640 RepID=UPI001040D3F6|nr:bifunctional diaminohydroxyphosphoribosylaminopyrimidine deaminase/5-amino-6-(5-phosphoribosylamino)uracil reductase RibD [Roseococcus sp. SYP-B2431]TCH96566.1 bifunctional diaminohydroxyphosphoribosylaminopyrimidine deaminase/5-amino-6-(5-phosphoribosylamino)uracil reductase RibD [Roseococcus sp. SYP-B2431]